MTTEINQDDDFAQFTIDGTKIDVDLYQASEKISVIERAHRDDFWECFDCQVSFSRASDDTTLACPQCKGTHTRRDESWLDDVAAFVRSLGVTRCGRNAAGKFYTAISDAMDVIKKKSNQTPGSPSGTELTAEHGGLAGEPLS